LLGALALLLTAHAARAVTFVDQIERLQAVYAALLDYRSGAPPGSSPAGTLALGLEVVPIPPLDTRVGSKSEPVHPPAAVARLRADWTLGAGISAGGVWLPPLLLQGYQADLRGAQLGYGLTLGEFRASARAYYLDGTVSGPISDRVANDTFRVTNQGGDARFGWGGRTWALYVGAGAGRSHSRLEVGSDGSVSDLARPYAYGFGGIGRTLGAWQFTLEQHQTEAYLSHLVLTALYAF
jgi:hypothetical protein